MAQKRRAQKPRKKEQPEEPLGCELLLSLSLKETGTRKFGWSVRPAWSPDGQLLAAGASRDVVAIWDASTGEVVRSFEGYNSILAVKWFPDGQRLAVVGFRTFDVLDIKTGQRFETVVKYNSVNNNYYRIGWSPNGKALAVTSDYSVAVRSEASGAHVHLSKKDSGRYIAMAWSPDGRLLASAGGGDCVICVWDVSTGSQISALAGHVFEVYDIAWMPNGQMLASAAGDSTIRLWDLGLGRQTHQLEAHTGGTYSVSFSSDGRLLASQGGDDWVRLWRCDTWETVAAVSQPPYSSSSNVWSTGAVFHPTQPILAVGSVFTSTIDIWRLDVPLLLQQKTVRKVAHYSNAKVVLVGNSSVGKSGLGLVLTGRKFRPTESTHGRHIWSLTSESVELDTNVSGTRETLLWDLAGQPGYRLLHQLHLNEVAVALVLFDSRSETDPFAGISYWAQALDEATHGFPLKKFLVASRSDRGGPKVSQDRIDEVRRRYGFDAYFETSAKSGQGVDELRDAVAAAIQWDKLPRVSTTELFLTTKNFLVSAKKKGLVITTQADLLARFLQIHGVDQATEDVFATCLGGLESAGLVRRLTFGNYVLLQPEMLDAYCGWLALAARDEPDGLGFIKEDDALGGNFRMDEDRPLKHKPEEKILLLATIHEVVARNVAYRQETLKGTMLVFPSELNAELPDYPGGYALAVAFHFRGPVSAIYATLAVILTNSLTFEKKALFKNAALYVGPRKQVCGFAIEYPDKTDDALGRLTLFFEPATAKDVRLLFLRFVNQQLTRLALENSVRRERIYHCDKCNFTIPPEVVKLRLELGEHTILCPVRGEHIPVDDLVEETDVQDEQLNLLDAHAEQERERQARLTVLEERRRGKEFHVFLCHNSKDKPVVRQLVDRLLEHGILAWFDDKEILAGERFPKKLEETIDETGALAVLIGPQGMGQWQEMEYHAALQRSIEERDENGRPRLRLIPVLLPGVKSKPDLPVFLRGLNYVDLRKNGVENREQIRSLVEAITTKKSPF